MKYKLKFDFGWFRGENISIAVSFFEISNDFKYICIFEIKILKFVICLAFWDIHI